MSTPKFTPGPWLVTSSTLVTTSEARVIAQCLPLPIADLALPLKEAAANARLIAAAPEMYTLLVEFFRAEENPRDMFAVEDDARALLAKIDGDTAGFTRCAEDKWCACTRRLDCRTFREADGYVACDQRCEARADPSTRGDWIANAIHWHYHKYLGRCAHGR